jgi:arylsulfatase A-like enzyme
LPEPPKVVLSNRLTPARLPGDLFLLAVWFGIVTGLIEGVGLLLFQRINWERWGPMMHASEQIIWISPLVDVILFSILVLAVLAASRLIPKLPAIRITVLLLATLAAYDWLALTERLRHRSSLLLAIGLGVAFSRWFHKHEEVTLRFWKRSLPWVVATVIVALITIQGERWLQEERALAKLPPFSPDSPNVLVIVIDTLRADHLSSYGYARPTSPNIDRVASQGVLFENPYSTTSWSFPSHVSLLTGRYPFQHGLEDVRPMPMLHSLKSLKKNPTLAEALAQRGYRTGAFSANRVYFSQDLGFGRGFTHFEDYFHSSADIFRRTLFGRELARNVFLRSDRSYLKRLVIWLLPWSWCDQDAEGSGNYSTRGFGVRKRANVVNHEVLDWIDRDRRRPFFAFLNYFDVHYPYATPPSYPQPAWNRGKPIDLYDTAVKYVDDSIGELMAELEKHGLSHNTVVVITSDHGESLGEHSLPGHGFALYRGQIHVPLIFWYPNHIPASVRVATPVSNAAIPATLMEVLGAGVATQFPLSALSVLWKTSQAPTQWPDTLSELVERKHAAGDDTPGEKAVPTFYAGPMKSLVTRQWHLIVHKNLGNQLYDWVHDPGETNNLIQTQAGGEIARSLISRMEDLLAGSGAGSSQEAVAITLHNGAFKASSDLVRTADGAPVNDYYRLEAEAGSTVTVEVQAQRFTPSDGLDPVVTIEDSKSQPLHTCRNPGDDQIRTPGAPDPTPDVFDDICVNDDINSGMTSRSRLQILVPGPKGSPVELRVRVSDWNGQVRSGVPYQIAITRDEGNSPVKAEAR